MKNNKKEVANNKTKVIVLLVVIIIILVGLLGFLLGRDTIRRKESNYIYNVYNEEEIKNIDDITELSTEIDTLLSYNSTEYIASNEYSDYKFRYKVLNNELTKEDKQDIVLSTATWNKITGNKWEKYDKFKDIVEQYQTEGESNWFINESHQLSTTDANERSVDLFGEKINNPTEVTGTCPSFLYDSKEQIYYRPSPQCGGISPRIVKSYKSKFIQKKNEAYVYVSFAYLSPDENNEVTIYKNFETDNDLLYSSPKYKDEYKINYKIYNSSDFVINEENYKEFSEYKFTFERASNGNYYFIKTEQTK